MAALSLLELLRRALTSLYKLQSWLPPTIAKQWRLGITLAFQAIPAIDPTKDAYTSPIMNRPLVARLEVLGGSYTAPVVEPDR